ncbi:hypothetical protein ACIGZJ_18020 [Kitasatospora sp. NPDC052868]|uniref:hypothetical protein n=1 Tax=Kitasatospora sp. NPDC052868 TaxID=3364060 RepID=UPI0037C7BEC7
MRSKFLAATLSSLALLGAGMAVPAQASAAPVPLMSGTRSCDNEVGSNDSSCKMYFNASKWYQGDWVAVHVSRDGYAWANGYSDKTNKSYQVRVRAANGEQLYSEWKVGGTGVGVSAGPVNKWSGYPAATLFFYGGGSLSITADRL